MKINIMSGYVSLQDFLDILNDSTNLKDMYLLCHQAGCPVYLLRDINNKCNIIWHPCIDEEKNVLHITAIDGIVNVTYEDEIQPFDDIEELKKDMFSKYMLGDNPFDSKYLVWAKKWR